MEGAAALLGILAELDVLAFDLQDVGTRFYAYISTLGLAMQATAEVHGIRHVVTDPRAVRRAEAGVNVLHAFWHQAPDTLKATFFVDRPFRNVTGTAKLYRMIMDGRTPEEIVAAWEPDVRAFLEKRKEHPLYP